MESLMESLDPSIIQFGRPLGHQFYDASHSIRADGDHKVRYPNKMSIVNPACNYEEMLPKPLPSLSPVSFHPLQHSWTLWFFKNDRGKPWEQNQCEIYTFRSVEQFWAVYNNIELASRLPVGCDYSLFKYGIKPMWEDTENRRGGRWLVPLHRQARPGSNGGLHGRAHVDNFWLEIMLCLIGEAFGPEHGKDKIGVWVTDCEETVAVVNVGIKIKESLALGTKIPIGFDAHEETKKKKGSMAKHLYKI